MSFEIIDTEEIYKGRAFRIQRLSVNGPDGKEIHYDLVKHPGAVALVPLDEQGRILFLSQYRIGVGQSLLEIPAGTLEPGEDPADCAARELREETGMAARSIRKLGDFFLAPGYSSECLHIFLATDLYYSPLEADADEYLQLEPMSVSEAYRMAQRGEFHDGKTLAALLLAMPHLMPGMPEG